MEELLSHDLLRGRKVYVSGGGSGVNLAIAEACAGLGADIAICGRTESTLIHATERIRKTYDVKAVYAQADVRDWTAVEAAFASSAEAIGPADAVVCGAAGNFLAPAEAISSKGFRAVTEIDLLGSFHYAKAGFEHVRQNRGAILFVSGGQSQMPFVHQAHVAAAKAGVDQLMRTLALEWGHLGIRVNSIVPGPVRETEGMKRLTSAAAEGTWTEMIPLGRFAEKEEIGRMAAVLLSPISSYITGAQIVVDGGMSLSGSSAFNKVVLEAAGP